MLGTVNTSCWDGASVHNFYPSDKQNKWLEYPGIRGCQYMSSATKGGRESGIFGFFYEGGGVSGFFSPFLTRGKTMGCREFFLERELRKPRADEEWVLQRFITYTIF